MIEVVNSEAPIEAPVQLDGITVKFDQANQSATIEFDPTTYRTWDWVIAVLQMGVEKAKEMGQIAKFNQIQQQQRTVFENEALRRNLRLN